MTRSHLRPKLHRPTRRQALIGAGAGFATLLLGTSPLRALELQSMHSQWLNLDEVPVRPGALPWAKLAKMEPDMDGVFPPLPPELAALDGQTVTIDGFALAGEEEPEGGHRWFALTAYRSHCVGCLPGGVTALVDVEAAEALRLPQGVVRMTGTMAITAMPEDEYTPIYRLTGARLVTV